MKINVGDYVRTKSGYIGKITSIDNEMNRVYYYTKKMTSAVPTQDIVKYVENKEQIINLIGVGDYINGYLVEEIYQPINKEIGKLIKFSTDNVSGWEYGAEEIGENDIKSIVTKEQFESMEYKI